MTRPPAKIDQTEIDDVIANYDGEALVKEMQQNLARLEMILGSTATNIDTLVALMESMQQKQDEPSQDPSAIPHTPRA